MDKKIAPVLTLLCSLWVSQFAHAEAPLLKAPPQETVAEAKKIIAEMRNNPRGPYDAIRWFCNDGAVLAPKAYACVEHGGGKQHAVFSAQRNRLAELGWRVGSIYASLDGLSAEQSAGARKYLRLRELPLEKYMMDIDDGWVLHKALSYRGRVQVEDEQKAGLDILLAVLNDDNWQQENFLLVRELVRVIPHTQDSKDTTRNIRRQSQLLAEFDKSFEPIRAEVHGQPGSVTAGRVRRWLTENAPVSAEIKTLAEELAAELEFLYSDKGSAQRLAAMASAIQQHDKAVAEAINNAMQAQDSVQRLSLLVEALTVLRSALQASSDERINLQRLDLMTELETELTVASRVAPTPLTREMALRRIVQLLQATWALGWLSAGEHLALSQPVGDVLQNDKGISSDKYRKLIRRLQLAPGWAQASIKHGFAEALASYQAVDARASRFVDDLLRGSSLMPLAEITHLLLLDSGRITGRASSLFGQAQENVRGLNPGLVRGRLQVLSAAHDVDTNRFGAQDIVVIPNTISSLFPAAGIVTIGEGNPLSHIQILARNLGIPNIVIDESLLAVMKEHDGAMVELAASADGRVVLRCITDQPSARDKQAIAASEAEKVPAPMPDLTVDRPLQLAELNAQLSGRVVGPKAANVGELARLFPDRIAPAVALPFGVFALHTESGEDAPRVRVKHAFAKLHKGELTEQAFLTELDTARATLAAMKLQPKSRQMLIETMTKEFGPDAQYGVFVRSDTNMEDLPQFTGAGLNETIPHVIGLENQLAAISRVWSSVYSRRAMAWRSRILSNPDDVFSSVLLMKSVPSDKSGVLVTTDLTNESRSGYTVSLSWGVGGAVDNESAASYLLKADGEDILLSEAKAPYQRYLKPEGGVGWRAAPAGGVLTQQETLELRVLAREIIAKYPPSVDADGKPLPWDIEFAFADGKLMLLQIRPLVQRGAQAAEKVVSSVIPRRSSDSLVLLNEKLVE